MVKFNELEPQDLQSIVDYINVIFGVYHIDSDSIETFWEYVDVGNKRNDMV